MRVKPRGITLSNAQSMLRIDWEDGWRCEIPLSDLRAECPCALCSRDEHQGNSPPAAEEPSNPGSGDSRVEVAQIHQVGNYALRVFWRDGHGSGIYSWEMLRRLCADARPSSGDSDE